MPKAIRIHRTGGSEFLVWEEVEVGEPGPGDVRVRHTAIGLSSIDTYHRTGLYPLPELPAIPGREAAGAVDALGDEAPIRRFRIVPTLRGHRIVQPPQTAAILREGCDFRAAPKGAPA